MLFIGTILSFNKLINLLFVAHVYLFLSYLLQHFCIYFADFYALIFSVRCTNILSYVNSRKYSKQIVSVLWGQQINQAAYFRCFVYLPYIMTIKHSYN